MRYRAEIDGLRAIAVIPVILFHAGFEWWSGGFIGVDIFFVISGYLITMILAGELDRGGLDLIRFYERRARRLSPALFSVMIVSTALSWALMAPHQFKDFSQSLIAVGLFTSNLLFWLESDYFDSAAEEKPLLHTWSLAVEEQYYLIFPLCLWLIWRGRRASVLPLVVCVSLLSLTLCEWFRPRHASAAFYLVPFRVWELLCGSAAALLERRQRPTSSELGAALGLGLILSSIALMDHTTPFPSLYTLPPVIGAASLMLYAREGTLTARILSAKPLVWIGLISYSTYLWHQPLFAFARMTSLEEPTALTMTLIALTSIGLGWLSWRWIERPFRDPQRYTRRFIFVSAGLCTLLFIALGAAGHLTEGGAMVGSLNPLDRHGGRVENRRLKLESWGPLRTLSGDPNYTIEDNPFDDRDWFEGRPVRAPRLLIVGNSHAKDLFNVLTRSESVTRRFALTRYGVQIRDLEPRHRFWESPNYRRAQLIIITSRYKSADIDRMPELLARLKREGKRVILVKSVYEYPEFRSGAWSLIDSLIYHHDPRLTHQGELVAHINRAYFKTYREVPAPKLVSDVNRSLEALGADYEIPVLDRMRYICAPELAQCYAVDQSRAKLFYDYGHHTLQGAALFGRRVDEVRWLEPTSLNEP